MEYRSIECIAAYNCSALLRTAQSPEEDYTAGVPVHQRPYGRWEIMRFLALRQAHEQSFIQ
jgi:hypothetical protein